MHASDRGYPPDIVIYLTTFLTKAPRLDCPLLMDAPAHMLQVITVDVSGCVFVTDLQSGHGTKLDDVWIKPQAERQLRVGSVLQFGASTRRYKLVSLEKQHVPI